MVGAGLVLKSFQRLTQVDLGFHPDGVTSIALPLSQRIAVDTGRIKRFVNTKLSLVDALPGVTMAALTSALPLGNGANYDGYLIDGRALPPSGNEDQT